MVKNRRGFLYHLNTCRLLKENCMLKMHVFWDIVVWFDGSVVTQWHTSQTRGLEFSVHLVWEHHTSCNIMCNGIIWSLTVLCHIEFNTFWKCMFHSELHCRAVETVAWTMPYHSLASFLFLGFFFTKDFKFLIPFDNTVPADVSHTGLSAELY